MATALFGTVSELETSVAGALLNRVATTIIDASILAFPNTKIHIRWTSWDKNLAFPFIILRPAPETHNPADGPMGTAVNKYRVMVTIAQAGNRDQLENMAIQLLWREQIEELFKKQHPAWSLPRNARIRQTSVIPGEPYIQGLDLKNIAAQFLLIDCEVNQLLGKQA